MMLLDIFTFSGRLHPLIVHLPIGFLIIAIVFDILSYIPKYQNLKPAVSITLFLSFIAAILASVFGYLLSLTGEYDLNILESHKFSGILFALLTGIYWLVSIDTFNLRSKMGNRLNSVLLIGLGVLLAFTGHQGASLTHGQEYLSFKVLTYKSRNKPKTINEVLIYEDLVGPILKSKCVQCHRADKMKGDLNLESFSEVGKGGKSGHAVVAGNLEKSELFRRVTLDSDHKEFMPSDGKPALTKDEVEIVKFWINAGASGDNVQFISMKDHQRIRPVIESYVGLSSSSNKLEAIPSDSSLLNPDIPTDINMADINALREKGLKVRIMLNKPLMLDVTLRSNSGIKLPEISPVLLKVSKNIIWLNLSENEIADTDLNILKEFHNLEKIRLDKNPITDQASEFLVGLKKLNAVNLNETNITEKSLNILAKNPNIKTVYSWNSKHK
ncbi:c-type cytochrome domain-containing protein [Sphingobacterium endophyticum]|uniref:c-type cytochrome domain-containing protein n=1 Tax=Sphingobacterium endophyticum TaxID=2546448 RepID=UPI0012E2824C|nr:c-type cytochrome domain-containing protein [Sphingobacterium endophyticum]